MAIEGVLGVKHLDEKKIVSYVEAMLVDKVHKEPKKIREHIADCEICSLKVIRLYKLMKSFPME